MKTKLLIIIIVFLTVVNYINAQLNVELLGTFSSPNASRHSDVWGYVDENGREYALLLSFEGTYIIDVTNPSNPQEISFFEDDSSIWRDAKVHENYAYVVTEGRGPNQPRANGLQIIDLSDLPNSAKLVKETAEFFNTSHNIFIEDGFLYAVGTDAISAQGGIQIIDLSDPVNPVLVSTYTQSDYVHDVFVRDNILIACAADHYAYIDVSDKSNPQEISVSASIQVEGGYAHSGWMTENNRYFYAADEGNAFDLRVYDLEDTSNWEIAVNTWQMPTESTIHNIFIRDNFAHISYYTDGYVVLDITNPEEPILAGHYDTADDGDSGFGGVWGCYPYLPSGNVLISDKVKGLFVFNFTGDDSVTDTNNSNELPKEFNVSQNYPNPFNPSTTLTFALPGRELVSINVFNILGQKVANLTNEIFDAGQHSVNFDAGELSSGIYLAKITSGSNTKLVKMNLVK